MSPDVFLLVYSPRRESNSCVVLFPDSTAALKSLPKLITLPSPMVIILLAPIERDYLLRRKKKKKVKKMIKRR